MIKRTRRLRVGLVVCWAASSVFASWTAARQESGVTSTRPLVYSAVVDALIHPVSAEFIEQTIARADADDAALVVITLRTPGGLVDSTRSINTSIIGADTPVVVYVGPSGTRAASAGFLITIAADVAAMAPGTHIGAAHPVSGSGAAMDEVAAEKAASDVAAYARSIASQRGRNVELAEKAVTESQSFTEQEALTAAPPLVDLVVSDFDDLLRQLDGRMVTRWNGETVALNTGDARVVEVEMNWRQELLSAIAHPQVAVMLFSLGTLGLTVELWNPGGIIPGIVGGLCLLLAFFAFQILPINYVGLLLILFGLLLLVAEMMTTTFGLLATGGIVSMVLGSVMLIDSPAPEMQLGGLFIAASMVGLAVVTFLLVRLGVRAQMAPPVSGRAGMIKEIGKALSPIGPRTPGRVTTHGEIWAATSEEDINEGDQVCVVSIDGMRLTVRRLTPARPGGSQT